MIILLNGPKGCGKDTIAKLLVSRYNFAKHEFKHVLYEETSRVFEIPVQEVRRRNEARELKEIPFIYRGEEFPSVRNMLIHTSEIVIKPKYGLDYFGVKAARHVLDMRESGALSAPIVFSDSGFEAERLALKDALSEPVVTVKLVREGYCYDAETDSRNYLSNPDLTIELVEDNPDVAVEQIRSYITTNFGFAEEK